MGGAAAGLGAGRRAAVDRAAVRHPRSLDDGAGRLDAAIDRAAARARPDDDHPARPRRHHHAAATSAAASDDDHSAAAASAPPPRPASDDDHAAAARRRRPSRPIDDEPSPKQIVVEVTRIVGEASLHLDGKRIGGTGRDLSLGAESIDRINLTTRLGGNSGTLEFDFWKVPCWGAEFEIDFYVDGSAMPAVTACATA